MSFTFNVASGKVGYYAGLPAAADGLLWVPILATGLGTSAELRVHATLAALLGSGKASEATGVGRRALTGVTWTVDASTGEGRVGAAGFTLTAPTGNPTGAAVVCYDPDTAAGDDTSVVPLFLMDFAFTPAGVNEPIVVPTNGLWSTIDAVV